MAVFRVQKTQNYTIMSNHHLRNKALSLKAKGLLSLMLSLPEDWDYTTRGLASICKEGPRNRVPKKLRLSVPNQNRQSLNGKNLYRKILHN